MAKLNLLTTSLLTAVLGLTACGGDDSSNHDPIETTKPENSNDIKKVAFSGVITDSSNMPLADATVKFGSLKTLTTDSSGAFTTNLDVSDDSIVVLVKKPGYLTTAREITVADDGTYTIDIPLSADQVSTAFVASAGIDELQVSGAKVSIPANSVVDAEGNDYNGTVNIASSYYNPDSIEGAQTFAQPFAGQNADGSNETGLVTVGVIDVKLTDPSTGAEFDLKEGAKATLTFPEASTDQDLETIPLWYYDEDKTIWVKDGVAIRQADGSYKGQVSHFTLWNADIPVGQYPAIVEGCFIDTITKERIKGGIDATIKGRGFKNSGSIDAAGDFSVEVPMNTPLTLLPTYGNNSFNAIDIPALGQNAVYKINNGDCIEAKDPTTDDVFNYVNVFDILPPEPVFVTPNPSPIDPPQQATPAGLIGYYFNFDQSYSGDTARLEDVELESIRATSNNTIESLEQSLYKNTLGDSQDDFEVFSLTTNGLEASYKRTYVNENLTKREFHGATYENNAIKQSLPNGMKMEMNFKPISIANRLIIEVLNEADFGDLPTSMIDTFNTLPIDLQRFTSDASCLSVYQFTHGPMDYIEFESDNLSWNNKTFEEYFNDFVNPMRGEWSGVPWASETSPDIYGPNNEYNDYSYDAIVEYKGEIYDADYYPAGIEPAIYNLDRCEILNEAAKDQVIEALSTAYPTL